VVGSVDGLFLDSKNQKYVHCVSCWSEMSSRNARTFQISPRTRNLASKDKEIAPVCYDRFEPMIEWNIHVCCSIKVNISGVRPNPGCCLTDMGLFVSNMDTVRSVNSCQTSGLGRISLWERRCKGELREKQVCIRRINNRAPFWLGQ
jgi:hypothetical protein